ncbi:MAG: hypothetical protein VW421_00745 [Gammaproteobacteria bacterium]
MNFCFASDGFAKFINIAPQKLLRADQPSPYILQDSATNFTKHFPSLGFYVTPICLSGFTKISDLGVVIEHLKLKKPNFGGCYIQTRVEYSDLVESSGSLDVNMILGHRTVLSVDLSITRQKWFSIMKSDAKARFKKCEQHLAEGDLEVIWIDFGDVPSVGLIKRMHQLYMMKAKQLSFASRYRFTFEQWQHLLADDCWASCLVMLGGFLIGFAVIGRAGDDYDYTFAVAESYNHCDLSRVLLLSTFDQLSGPGVRAELCIGGGISEGDSLEQFKKRMGTKEKHYCNIKYVIPSIYEKTLSIVGDLKRNRWP